MDGKDVLREARPFRRCRSSCCRRASARPKRSRRSTPGPTTMWKSRSASANCWRGCAQLCVMGRATRARFRVSRAREYRIDFPKHLVTKNGSFDKVDAEGIRSSCDTGPPCRASAHAPANSHAVWGVAHQDDTQYLRVFIGQLRAKLEDDPAAPRIILTEPGIGYRFNAT